MYDLTAELEDVLAHHPGDLARGALVIAKLEYPHLDPAPSLAALEALGARAAALLDQLGVVPVRARIAAINRLVFDDERFAGNRAHYDDFRNSLLNVVLERRLGIPISLALVYMEVARRAGLEVFGVAFPGHFLVRVPTDAGVDTAEAVILDPFNRGCEVDEAACRFMLAGQLGDGDAFDRSLLQPCTTRQFFTRLLNNLKRTYVEIRSFPQARAVTDMLIALDPTEDGELRNRGLLAYHLDDFPAALRDLEDYLGRHAWADESRDERDQIWEHVKTLRRRVAALN